VEYLEALFLGVIQGLTEFLPVSSSGHLVLFQQLFGGFEEAQLFEDIMLHIGTLVAVLVFCRHEILMLIRALGHLHRSSRTEEERSEKRLFIALLIAGIPTVILGFTIKATMVPLFNNPLLLAGSFAATTILLIWSRFLLEKDRKLSPWIGLGVGTAQGLAVIPGISRSGSTIVVGQALGLNRQAAARFAFVLSVPAILGAALFTTIEVIQHPTGAERLSLPVVCGMIASAIVGYMSLMLLTAMIDKARLHYFAWYTGLVSLFCLLWGLGIF